MAKLPTRFSGTPSSVKDSADGSAYLNASIRGLDSAMDIGDRMREDAEAAATSSVIAEAMRTGQSPAQVMEARERIFGNPQPGVDYNKVGIAFDGQLTAAKARAASDAAREASDSARRTSDFNFKTAVGVEERKAEVLKGSNALSDWIIGDFHTNAVDAVNEKRAEHEKARGKPYTDAEWSTAFPQAVEDYKANQMVDPDFWGRTVQKFGITLPEFEKINKYGQDFALTKAELRADSLEESKKDATRREAFHLAQVKNAGGEASMATWNGSEYVSQKPLSTENYTSARNYALSQGVNIEDENTATVVDFLSENFPESNAFRHELDLLRGSGSDRRDEFDISDMDVIDEHRQDVQSQTQLAIDKRLSGGNYGGSWEQNLAVNLEALDSFKKEAVIREKAKENNKEIDVTDSAQYDAALKEQKLVDAAAYVDKEGDITAAVEKLRKDVNLKTRDKHELNKIENTQKYLRNLLENIDRPPIPQYGRGATRGPARMSREEIVSRQHVLVARMKALQENIKAERRATLHLK